MVSVFDKKLIGSVAGLIGSILLSKYRTIISFTGTNQNVIRLHPPYITKKEHIDYFINSLNQILDTGINGIVKQFMKSKLYK